MKRRLAPIIGTALLMLLGLFVWVPLPVQAGIYSADTEVTYKEYWVPHSQFTAGCDAHGRPSGGSWYLEPWPCEKTVTINIPDDFSRALKVEVYLDLWRNHNRPSARFKVNGGPTHAPNVGSDWSRTPWIGEIPKGQLIQGDNTLLFWNAAGGYHIHDIAVRIYFDAEHPLFNAQGVPITAPTGALVSIEADNGTFTPNGGGNLLVNSDQVVLVANTTSNAKFVEFHGYYDGYDEDNNGLFLDWHNLGRNNWHPGGTSAKTTGGTINHIGTVLAPTPGTYQTTWNLPYIVNQNNVKFKLRIVDNNYVVREAAGGISAQFALQRTRSVVSYRIPNFQDAVLHHSSTPTGQYPDVITRTLTLPADLSAYDEIYLIGAFWENPWIRINNQTQQRAFSSGQDVWALSVRQYSGSQFNWWVPGANRIAYLWSGGFGQFIEKPGPMVVLKQSSPDTTPPVISNQSCTTGSTSQPRATIRWHTNEPATSRVDYGPTASLGQSVQVNTPKTDHVVVLTEVDPQQPLHYRITATDSASNSKTTDVLTCPAFTVDLFLLTTNMVGEGQVAANPPQPAHLLGTQVSLTATPAEGWMFAGWTPPVHEPLWLDPLWGYRFSVTVAANGYARTDKPVELDVNFTSLLSAAGASGAFAVDSLRVVEVGADGSSLDPLVPFQFDPASNFDAATNAAGKLIFLLKGATAPDSSRTYHVYFDVAGQSYSAPVFDKLVSYTDDVLDQGQASYQVQTLNATYYYHKQGAGFSSLVDVDGNDWIDYRPTGGAGGNYRGIPNAVYPEGHFHPGATTATSQILHAGPLKLTIRSVTNDDKWETLWEIYPHYAKMTMVRKDHNYWFLYEGTPGGLLEPTSDLVVRSSDAQPQLASVTWTGDIPGEEWVYFGDPNKNRSLYVINHQEDTLVDSYYPMDGKMTVFGFGRSGTNRYLAQTPAYFTVGLVDTVVKAEAEPVIRNAYKDLAIQTGAVTRQVDVVGSVPSPANPIKVTMVADRALTANFVPLRYTLTVDQIGSGSVVIDPARNQYESGELVTLTAVPSPGWIFDGWDGALSGGGNPVELVMDSDKVITALFLPSYTLNVNVVGAGGGVQVTPNQSVFVAGDVVTLTAITEPGWTFIGWSGAITGSSATVAVMMDGNKTITATFVRNEYTLAITVPTGGGTVKRQPDKEKYFYDDVVTVTAAAQNGWVFTGWAGALSGDVNPQSLLITGDTMLQATFAQTPYTVSTNVVGNGSIVLAPNQAFYPLGAQVTVTALPGAGWSFSHWSGGLNGTNAQATLTVNGNQSVTATFVPLAPTLTVNTNGNGTVAANPLKATYQYKEPVTLTATPASGWHFAGWSGDLSGDANPVTIELDSNKSIVANFAQTIGGLTTQVVGQGQVLVNPLKTAYAPGERVELVAVPDLDWLFSGWSGALSGESNPATLVMNGSQSVTATFVKALATGEIKSDDFNHCAYSTEVWTWIDPLGDATPPRVTGEEILLAVPGGVPHDLWRNGIQAPHLVQQVDDQNFAVMAQFNSPVNERIQLQGLLFKEDESRAVRVNFQREGSTTYLFVGVLRGSQSPQARAKIALAGEAPLAVRVQRTDNQWTFWYRSGAGEWTTEEALSFTHALAVNQVGIFVGNASASGNPAPVHTAVVDYFVNLAQPLVGDDPRANVLPIEVVGQGEVTRDRECGNPVELTANSAPGWRFDRWEARTPQGVENLGDANPLTVTFVKGMAVTAIFDPIGYQLNVTTVGQGTVGKAPDKTSYTHGETVTLTAQPHPGWRFVGWSGDVTGADAQIQVTVQKELNVQATFVESPGAFSITTTVVGEGTVTKQPDKASYSPGEVVTLTAQAQPGWRFSGWGGDASGTEPQVQVTVQKDLSIQATFSAEPQSLFTLTTTVVGNGSVTLAPQQAQYQPGAVVTATATPGSGWLFLEWGGDLSGADNPHSLTVDANKHVTAHFGATMAGILVASPNGQVLVNPIKEVYQVGDEVELTAVPNEGWEFVEWQINEAVTAAAPLSSANPLAITIDGHTTYEPKFRQQGATASNIIYLPVISQP